MQAYSIVPAEIRHVRKIVRDLRAGHAQAMSAFGVDPYRALQSAFYSSSFRRAWIVDGELAGIGGVTGTVLSSSGVIWLALTQRAIRFPVAIVREARRQLREIMATRSSVESAIVCGDPAAWRFAEYMGFRARHPKSDQIMLDIGNRSLERILEEAPEFRINLPGGLSGVLVGAVHG